MDRRFHLIPLGIMPWEWLLMIPDMEPWRKWMRKNKHSMSIKQKEPMRKRYLILNSFHTTFIFQWYTGCICIIDQGWSQHGGILAEFFFCVFMDQDKVEVHKNRKKNKAASHIQPSWPKSSPSLSWVESKLVNFSGQDRLVLPAQIANEKTGFTLYFPQSLLVIWY